MHKSVGAIIKNKEGSILMIDRSFFPFGWACPAGHVDEGEMPEKALAREVKEETNLNVKKQKLLIHEFVEWNECVKGVRGHDWYVYQVLDWDGEISQNEREEKNIKWIPINEVSELKLEEVWKQWFKRLKII